MDEAKHGVIYLSLGSLLEPDILENLGKKFTPVFKDIPQRVIMKWDPQLLSDIPPNVLVEKWISQNDVLSKHMNTHLFDQPYSYMSLFQKYSNLKFSERVGL